VWHRRWPAYGGLFAVDTRGGSRMRESCTYGSVRGAPSNGRPYRDRREFITLLGGGLVAWPFAGHSQQPRKVPRIGVLLSRTPASFSLRTKAFLEGLRNLGYVEGQTIEIEWKWGQKSTGSLRSPRSLWRATLTSSLRVEHRPGAEALQEVLKN
jgi:hypothetical protein